VPGVARRLQPTIRCIPIFLLLACLVSACAPQPPPPKYNLTGFPPAFRDGYDDGCRSAKPGALKRRQETRFKNDAQYASGWRDGYDICRKYKAP